MWASSITNGANPGSSTRSARLLTGANLWRCTSATPRRTSSGSRGPTRRWSADNRGDRASAIDPRLRRHADDAGRAVTTPLLTSGIATDTYGNARRTAPSSGALYPIEVYAVVHRVEGIEPAYHYAYQEHGLEQVRSGDYRAKIVEQGISQQFLGECGVVLFLTMILQRMRPKYQDRSYRYGLLEAGHLGENAYLAATSMGLAPASARSWTTRSTRC